MCILVCMDFHNFKIPENDMELMELLDQFVYMVKVSPDDSKYKKSLSKVLIDYLKENDLDSDPHNFVDFSKVKYT